MVQFGQAILATWQGVDPAIRARSLALGALAAGYIGVLARRQHRQRQSPDRDPVALELLQWERLLMFRLGGILVLGVSLPVVGALNAPDFAIFIAIGAIGALAVLALRASWMVGRLSRRVRR